MGHTANHMDDFVVDMVLEVDSRGIGVEDLARRICLPGMEILRTSARGTIWLTALVTAEGESAAIRAGPRQRARAAAGSAARDRHVGGQQRAAR